MSLCNWRSSRETFADPDKIEVSHEDPPGMGHQPPVHLLGPLQLLEMDMGISINLIDIFEYLFLPLAS